MAVYLQDRTLETTTSTGTGAVVLDGAVLGYREFSWNVNGVDTYYVIEDPVTGAWEVGIGRVFGPSRYLARDTVLYGSNYQSKVDFAAGTKNVFQSVPADKTITVDNVGEYVDDRVGSLLVQGTGIGLDYNDGNNTLTVSCSITQYTNALAVAAIKADAAWKATSWDSAYGWGNHASAGYYASGGTDVALADGGTGASLTDPNVDRILFWDDSAGAVTWLTPNTGLAISGTNLNCSITQYTDALAVAAIKADGAWKATNWDTAYGWGNHASAGYAAAGHNHTGVYQPAGTYYAPSGTDVALADGGTGASLADPNADCIMFWDDSAGAVTWLTPNTGLAISGTNLNCSITQYTDALAVAAIKADGAWKATNWDTAYGWGNHASAGYYASGGTDVALADGGTGASLADPNADRILFWDDSAGTMTWLACGNSVAITTTTLDTAQDIRTSASPTFQGVTVAKTVAGSVIATIKAETINSASSETHASTFSSQDNNSGTVRALFCCAGPLNAGVADQGYFDFLNEAGTLYIGRFKSLAADSGATLSLYNRATPQVVKVHLHTAGVSYITGGAVVVGATTASDSADFYVAGKISMSGELEVNGDLNHDGTNVGFFGVPPTTRPTAYTQTYSTASKTVPNATASNPPAGGTGATAGAYDTAANRNAMITSLTNVIADVDALRKVVTAIIDDLQALGLLQ